MTSSVTHMDTDQQDQSGLNSLKVSTGSGRNIVALILAASVVMMGWGMFSLRGSDNLTPQERIGRYQEEKRAYDYP